ncbi:MAG: DUF362 domain-containing protein [Thermodesulfobacteriota bacterium]
MEKMSRRDFIKTTGVIAGTVALSGMPGIVRAKSTATVAVVKSKMDLGAAMSHSLFPCFMDTTLEQAREKLRVPEVSWSPESMAEIERMLKEAFSMIGGLPVKSGDTVLIKPNLVQPPHMPMFHIGGFGFNRAQCMISDVRAAIAVAKMARQMGAKKVIIGEENASRVADAWRETGYASAVAAMNDPAISTLDFWNAPFKYMKPPKPLALAEYAVPELLEKTDVLINIAPMKTHMWAGTTMTMKNFIGLPAGNVYGNYKAGLPHNVIADIITDLTALVLNRVRTNVGIITAVYAGEGVGPLTPEAVPLNTILVGRDYVALDAVGTTVMGFDAGAIGYIRKAHKTGLGTMKDIDVVGTPIKDIQFAAKPVAEGARQHGGEVTDWTSKMGRTLPS